MNLEEIQYILKNLKYSIQNRIKRKGILQGIINENIDIIENCINKNISIKLIHEIIFQNNEITYNHLRNLIFRARKRIKNKKIIELNFNQKEEKNENKKIFIKPEKHDIIHDNKSDQNSADERLKKLLLQKEKINEK